MSTLRDATKTEVKELTPDEASARLDNEARRILGMSGQEFARKWEAGEFSQETDPRVTQVAMLLPNAW